MREITELIKPVIWNEVYEEAQLYKAAVRLYTAPVFSWRKALSHSSDNKTFYDFARHGLSHLEAIHTSLLKQKFHFRPGVSLDFNTNGKHRTVYIYPWEERLVDVLLYRLMNQQLEVWFSDNSYAYKLNGLGVDICQRKVAEALREADKPLYIIKRDVSDYFNSIDHQILLQKLKVLVKPDDYLFELLRERIQFRFLKEGKEQVASKGVPFGTAISCLFANIYLTELDRSLESIKGLHYFRYSDDMLLFSSDKEAALEAEKRFKFFLSDLKLVDKESHRLKILFSTGEDVSLGFEKTDQFKHLGLQFSADGQTRLSRDKCRKICNIFKYAIRRKKVQIARIKDINKRIETVIQLMRKAMTEGIRNVAILDYYLRHIKDEIQLKLLDRWLAEEALAVIFENGHKKGNFGKLSYQELRKRGLPSLVHRRRLIAHGHIETSFLYWKNYQLSKASKGKVAKRHVFSSIPEAVAIKSS